MGMIGSIINSDGEILGEICEGDRILRKKISDKIETTNVWKIEHFYKGHISEIRKVLGELNTNERAFLFSIATYVGYEDCCLKYDNGNELNFDALVELSKMGRGTVSEVINGLIKKDILYKGKNSSRDRQYFVNPWLFCKGNRINKVLKTMFKNYKIRVLNNKEWGKLK